MGCYIYIYIILIFKYICLWIMQSLMGKINLMNPLNNYVIVNS